MASPFAFFRRNQKVGMAVLTLLAMFAFVFLDSINRNAGGRNTAAHEVLVKTDEGNLDRLQMQRLMQNRQRANQFMAEVFRESWDAAQQAKQQLNSRQPVQFGFGLQSFQKDVLLGYLFRKEAEKAGIVVKDEAIELFLRQASEYKLSGQGLRNIVREMQTSIREVYDVLRDELQARYFFQFSRPADPVTPAELWTYYQRLNVRQVLEVAELPVEAFTSKVADPTDAELQKFFETYKNRYAHEFPDEDKPGFKQPRKVDLQYVTLSYEEIEKLVPDITDKDVTEYYEKNKETLYKNNPFPEDAKKSPEKPEEKGAAKDEKKPDAPAAKSEQKAAPEKGKDTPAKPAEEKKPEAAKPPMTPAPAPKKTEAAPMKTDGKPAETKPADKKPEEKKQGMMESRAGRQIAAASEKQSAAFFAVEDKPQEKKPEAAKPAEAKKADAPAAPKKEEPAKPAPPAKPMTDGKPAVTPPATEKKPEGDKKTEGDKKEAEPTYRPLDANLKDEIKDQLLRERTMSKVQDLARQVSEKMTDIGLKYNAPVLADGNKLYMDLDGNGKFDKGEPEVTVTGKVNPDQITPEQRNQIMKPVSKMTEAELQRVAAEAKMKYGSTGIVSLQELKKLPGIGMAQELEAGPTNPFENSAAPIDRVAFGDESLFRPTRMQDSEKHDLYVVWKVRLEPEHVAKFEEEGIKAQVLKAWKLEQARPLAQKRADALVEIARKAAGKPLQESLEKQTITGDMGNDELKVQSTGLFSWLRTSEVPGPNPLASESRPEMSQPAFVKSAGTKFMETVFDQLKVGEIGVAPNFDGSCLYVVQVKERVPAADDKAIALEREAFIKSRLFGFNFGGMRLGTTPYDILSDNEQQQVIYDWVQQLEKRHRVEWVKEDNSQDQES